MTTSTYMVSGMTCSHCVGSVTEEISSIPGVQKVDVDLSTGGVDVTSDAQLDDDLVREAVQEAGYRLLAI